ncbi:MAG: sensor histidine kinase [Streptosporangiales bacterium]|nr:sensor histidine kinase [Streptosporangiales bacterium]
MTRLEKARKAFVYTTDISVGIIAVSLSIRAVWAAYEDIVSVPVVVLTVVLAFGVCMSFARTCRAAMRSARRPTLELVLAGVAGAAALLLSPRADAGATALVWTAMTALYLPWWAVIACGAGMVGATTIYYDMTVGGVSPWLNALFVAFQVAAVCAFVRVWLFLWRVLKEAHQAQDAKTQLAVSEERLRFARDLHDLLGHSLSVISVKSELAAKLVERRPDQATAEIMEVRRLAKESLREVRTAVQGYRSLDLDQELTSARSVLEAAGVECDVANDGRQLPDRTRTLFAWVVREGATNVLKHRTAARCLITIEHGVLEMRNDGLGPAAEVHGSGLDGLAERLAAVGGKLDARRTSTEFLLRAEVPA